MTGVFPEDMAKQAAAELHARAAEVAARRPTAADVTRRHHTGRAASAAIAMLGVVGVVAVVLAPSRAWIPLVGEPVGGNGQEHAPPAAAAGPMQVAFAVLAVSAIDHETMQAQVVDNDAELQTAWDRFGALTSAPRLPEGADALLVPMHSGTCRSTDDVVDVTVSGSSATVVFAADAQLLRPCPGPAGAPRRSLFVISVSDEIAAAIDRIDVQFANALSSIENQAELETRKRVLATQRAALVSELEALLTRRSDGADNADTQRFLERHIAALRQALARLDVQARALDRASEDP